MFGQSGNKPFGTATVTPFGANTSFGGFGGTTPATGGLFGSTATTTQSTGGGLFGGGTAFGGATQSTGFPFAGTNTQNTGSSLFGNTNANQQQNTSIFGTPAASTAFGGKTPGFGTSQASGGLFGTASNAGSTPLFGTATTTSAATGGLFGGTSAFGVTQQATNGTTIKFNPTAGQDTMMKGGVSQNISTRHQCITAMKEYESKSMEELRTEDYLANRKGPQQGSTGLFSQTATTQASTGFSLGAPKTGFGTTGGGLFGSTTPATGGGLFGSTATTSAGGGLFGSTTTTTASSAFGGFGTQQSLFGQNTQQKSLFGATSTAPTGGLFGTTTTTASTGFGGFGQTQSQGGLFANKQTTPFGTATTSSGFGFGTATSTTGGLFANKMPATGGLFGGNANTGTAFGTNTGTSLFGNKSAGFGTGSIGTGTAFGTGITGGLNTGGSSLFGGAAKPTFGNTGTAGFGAGTTGFGGVGGTNLLGTGATGTTALGGNTNALQEELQMKQQLALLTNSPYGDNPLFKNLQQQDEKKKEEILKPTNPLAQKAVLNASTSQYKVSPRHPVKVKPKPLQSLMSGKQQLFDGLEDDDISSANDTFVPRRSIKKLVIKNKSPSSLASITQSQVDDELVAPSTNYPREAQVAEKPDRPSLYPDLEAVEQDSSIIQGIKAMPTDLTSPQQGAGVVSSLDDTIKALNTKRKEERFRSDTPDSSQPDLHSEQEIPADPHPGGIVLNRSEYYTIPTLDELVEFVDEDGDCFVENFVVGREGYGNVFFPGVTNVANMNLDEIVHFRRKEVTLYPDDDEKPPVGEGLNKKAQVTLDCVWPNNKTTQSPIKDPDQLHLLDYQDKIEQATIKIGAKFVEYRPDTGSWVFEVKHFSKYGLLDDSDEEETDPEKLKLLKKQKMQQFQIQKKKINVEDAPQQMQLESLQHDGYMESMQPEQQYPDSQTFLPPKTAMEERHLVREPGADGAAPAGEMEEDQDMQESGYQQEMYPDEAGAMAGEEEMFGDTGLPSSYHLAASLGANAHNVQVMKASFFGDQDEAMETGVTRKAPTVASLRARLSSMEPAPLEKSVFKRSMLSTTISEADSTVMDDRSSVRESISQPPSLSSSSIQPSLFRNLPQVPEPLSMPTPVLKPIEPRKRLVGSRIHRHLISLNKSVMHQKQHCVMDAGLLMGRSFRVGWGPNWTLAHCGKPVLQQVEEKPQRRFSLLPSGDQTRPKVDTTPFRVTLEQVDTGPHLTKNDPVLQEMAERHLQIHLNHSENAMEDNCPIFVPRPGVEALHKYAEQAQQDSEQIGDHPDADTVHHTSCVWDLMLALWGDLEFHIEDEIDRSSYAYHMARREAFSKWLSSTSSQRIKKEVQDSKFRNRGHLLGLLSYTSGRKVSEACDLAQESGDHRLALLIAQSAGSMPSRQFLISQLYKWHEQQADEFVEPERLKLYCLLAGMMVWKGSKNSVNVCEDLDWKRCLALHLWYLCSPSATINDAMTVYDKAFSGAPPDSPPYSAPPLPPYIEDASLSPNQDPEDPYIIRDTCYHLLKLYCQRSHRLERTLAPSSSTPNPLDYRLSWQLSQVLQSLDYTHISDEHKSALCCNYASQLENMGLWHWATFVLLHITDKTRREKSVRDLMCKHISIESSDQDAVIEDFLHLHLHIPKTWIHLAKSVRAHQLGEHRKEAWHLLLGGEWNQSHRVLLRHIAPDAIINEEYDYLQQFLEKMSPHSTSVLDWDVGGKVYLDFLSLMNRIHKLKRGTPQMYEVEQLQPEVMSLCGRVDRIYCYTAKHRLCQSELAKRVAVLLRTILTLQNPDSETIPTRLLAPYITKLPMPEDYTLQELRELTRGFIHEIASET